jgi:hypothetical protein
VLCARLEDESRTATDAAALASTIAQVQQEYGIVSQELRGVVEIQGPDAGDRQRRHEQGRASQETNGPANRGGLG